MMQKFTDPRLVALNREDRFVDGGMRRALLGALEPGEMATAAYSVSAHIWVEAVLTDRALLLVKGAVRAKVTRVPLPLEVTRPPAGSRTGVRVRTALGKKTLWGSKLDPDAQLLLGAAQPTVGAADLARETADRPSRRAKTATPCETDTATRPTLVTEWPGSPETAVAPPEASPTRGTRRQARKAAGPRPGKPRRRRVRKRWMWFAPPSTIWEMAHHCVKCGRPLTDPRSRRARVGTKCIRVYGPQQRRIPNPAHAAWIARKTKADVANVAEKVRAEAEFARAKATYDQARAEWTARLRSAR